MAITREFNEQQTKVVLLYKGDPITPEIDTSDARQILDVLSVALDKAYQKLRDAGLD